MHRQFFKLISQNPNYLKTHCIDLNNAFHLVFVNGCRKTTHRKESYNFT